MNNINQIVKTLKDKGLRVTPQRYAVYANLLERSDHPTVEQLLLDLNGAGPRSSQATVYSSLLALREVGLVREVLLNQGSVAMTRRSIGTTISAVVVVVGLRTSPGTRWLR
jgi:Fe2+ or Zn2+ uptake regulation protein